MVRCSIEVEKKEQEILKQIVLAGSKNVKKRKLAAGISAVTSFIMLAYIILIFPYGHIGQVVFGVLLFAFFLWLAIKGVAVIQKKVLDIALSKLDDKLTSGKREYCFDADGIQISSDFGSGTHLWNAFTCWGIFQNYIYIRMLRDEFILVDQNSLSESSRDELKLILTQNLKQESL